MTARIRLDRAAPRDRLGAIGRAAARRDQASYSRAVASGMTLFAGAVGADLAAINARLDELENPP